MPVDEYQDTNVIQYNIVKMLVNEERNIVWWETIGNRFIRGEARTSQIF